MKLLVELDIDEQVLFNRKCARCGSEDFRAVTFIPHEQHVNYNPGLSSIVEPFQVGATKSQTTFPMSICLGCKRLSALL